MSRSILPKTMLSLIILLLGCGQGEQMEAPVPEDLEARARAIHESVITIDTHDDIGYDFATPAVDPLNADRQVNLEKMRAGGLDAGFFIVFVGQTDRTPSNYEAAQEAAMTKFEAIHRMAEELYPDQIEIAYSSSDVERIHDEGKLVAAIGIENGYVIGDDLALLERYHSLGARYMTLAHSGHNDIADSSTPREGLGDPDEEHGGLSVFGEEVVMAMNHLGMMIDVSHISKNAAMQAIQGSRAPVIASHSSVYEITNHARNMDDETLISLRDNGGVVQITAYPAYVKSRSPEYVAGLQELRANTGFPGGRGSDSTEGMSSQDQFDYEQGVEDLALRFPPASVSDLVDHIDYAVTLIGIEHVGISSDFDGGGGVSGWNDASETFNVTLELVGRGYTNEQIRLLWGGNLLRVWQQVEDVAVQMQAGN